MTDTTIIDALEGDGRRKFDPGDKRQSASQFRGDAMPNLMSLDLANYSIDNGYVIDLLNAGILQRLSHISLIENDIGDQAAIELADRLGQT